jgi:SAM-dependent methyltransferase
LASAQLIQKPPALDGYDPSHFARLFAVEDRHFWFRSRNDLIGRLVGQLVAGLKPGYSVLEVGCGTGNVLRVLEQTCSDGQVVGMDLFEEGLQYARRRVRCPLVCGDLRSPPFETPFDLVGMFDVLEHMEDDHDILTHLHRLVRPGGHLILTVPAHMSLWSYFDESGCHYRRYDRADLRFKLKEAGFEVQFLTEFMMTLFPLVWLGRRLNGLGGGNSAPAPGADDHRLNRELRIVPGVNGLLIWLLRLENWLIGHRLPLPMGTSLLAIARRPTP